MKMRVIADEYYPFFTIEPYDPRFVMYTDSVRDIPEDKIKKIKRVMKDFEEIQEYLREITGWD